MLANEAPITQMNIATMREYCEFTLDYSVFANRDSFAFTRNIADAGRTTQFGTRCKLTRRATQKSLNEIIEVHVVILIEDNRSR
jgi:hypothetical protein